MAESKTVPTPIVVRPPFTFDRRLFDNATLYRSIVGGFNYLAVTRPDIQYAVNRNLELSVYSDSDWANDMDDHSSTTGNLLFLGLNLISWCTKKKTRVSHSSTKAEYRAMEAVVVEAMWFHHITDAL
uniref:Reverse transcriptase Ty1/copia-type domain-containing protein n=1 Tax=Solanum lycopersicum TaxID=4081 RepID=A0A3Q7JD49_SOLLC